jgi:hypothetical protein
MVLLAHCQATPRLLLTHPSAAARNRRKILSCRRSSASARRGILDTALARRARRGGARITCSVIFLDLSEADASGKNSQTTCASYLVKGRLRTRVTRGRAPFGVTFTSFSFSGAGACGTGPSSLAGNCSVMLFRPAVAPRLAQRVAGLFFAPKHFLLVLVARTRCGFRPCSVAFLGSVLASSARSWGVWFGRA